MAAGLAGKRPPFWRASVIFIVIHLLFVLVPLATVCVWAFTAQWPWPELLPLELSDRGIQEIFRESNNLDEVLLRSVGIALAVAVLTTLVASMAARALVHYRFFGREAFRFATVLPFLVPSMVFAMGVQVTFLRMGLAGTVPGVIIAHMIVALPYAIMIMTDVTAAAGTRLEEQARACGASPLQVFLHVQVPMLLPGILSASSMSYIVSFSQYLLTLLIGKGQVVTFALVMFPYLNAGDRTIASAYGLVFMLVTFAVFLVFEVILKRYATRETDYFNG